MGSHTGILGPEWHLASSNRLRAKLGTIPRGPYVGYTETQWEAGRHKQELEQETMKGTRTGE